MKKIILIAALLLTQSCFAKNQMTNTMDELYKEMIKDHSNNPTYIQKIKEVQKKYHEFLEAQVDLMYIPEQLGTVQNNCVINYKTSLDRALMNETKYLFYVEDYSPCRICFRD